MQEAHCGAVPLSFITFSSDLYHYAGARSKGVVSSGSHLPALSVDLNLSTLPEYA